MKKVSYFLFLFVFLFSNSLKARDNSGYNKDSSKKAIKINAFKFAPMEMMNGDFPVYFEHRFNDRLSAQFSVGVTFKDLFWELSRVFSEMDAGHETEANAGFSAKAEGRYYFTEKKNAIEGAYFAARASYRYYDVLCAVCLDRMTLDTGPFLPEHRSATDGVFVMGYQFYTKGNFIIDSYIGGGVRMLSGKIARCIQVNGSEPIGVLKYEQDLEARFSIGIRLGFGL